jgi:hypothetical protein
MTDGNFSMNWWSRGGSNPSSTGTGWNALHRFGHRDPKKICQTYRPDVALGVVAFHIVSSNWNLYGTYVPQ